MSAEIGPGAHILVVDDSAAHVATIAQQLKADPSPMKVTVARTLAEARECLLHVLPDLVLVTLMLPDGTGGELLAAEGEPVGYPVVVMTERGNERLAVDTMKAGALDYVVKSDDNLADMSHIVERALREWQQIVARRRAEQSLRDSEEQFRSFFESAASSMAIVGLDGKILQVNPTFCRLSGYSREELLSKSVFDVTHPDDHAPTRRLYEELLAGTRASIDYEKRYVKKDGSIIWGRATVARVQGAGKDQLYYAANVKDITERKQSERLLRESQQKLQLVLDNIPQFVFWKDRNLVYQGCNQNFSRAAGLENPQQIVGKTDYDLPWQHEESDFYRQYDQRVMESDTAEYHIIERQLQADGHQAWVDTNKVPLHDGDGSVVGILGTYEDITPRIEVEEALRESEVRFRSLFESAAAGMFTIAPTGRFLSANPAFCTALGYNQTQLLDKTVGDVTHIADQQRTATNYAELLQGHCRSIDYEKRFVRQDGRLIWGHVSVASVAGDDHKPKYYVGMLQDITARKLMEQRLQVANRELEAFVYTVSHDLRSPLTAMIGYADFLPELCQGQLDEQARDCLAQITAAGQRMMALMEDLLVLARVGQVDRPTEATDSAAVVGKVVEQLASRLIDVGAQITVDEIPSVRVPETLLTQLFDNLIGNAIRYAVRSGDVIEVGGQRQGGKVAFYVRDHGPGIAAVDLGRLFDVFFRGQTAKGVAGTGVGLATVKKIAQIYGGRAWVEETPGGGSTFWVEMVDGEPDH